MTILSCAWLKFKSPQVSIPSPFVFWAMNPSFLFLGFNCGMSLLCVCKSSPSFLVDNLSPCWPECPPNWKSVVCSHPKIPFLAECESYLQITKRVRIHHYPVFLALHARDAAVNTLLARWYASRLKHTPTSPPLQKGIWFPWTLPIPFPRAPLHPTPEHPNATIPGCGTKVP